jgi:molybdopterin-guanine dinucleotide biosynthesis protein B
VIDRESLPVVSLVGRSGVGKTTVLEGIIREMKRRGRRIGTVKHDTHGFSMDKPGKDTWRHAQAGSEAVVISGPRKMAMIRLLDEEMSLDEIVPLMGNVELVLTEGYKRGAKPKIEVSRLVCGTELLCEAEELVAVVADYPVELGVQQFGLDDAAGLCDLLERLFLQDTEVQVK